MMKDFKTGIDGTGTISALGNIQFLRTMLRGESLREFDVIADQVGSTTNAHLKQIKEGLLRYFFSLNALNKAKPRHEECNEEIPSPPIQYICGTKNGIK